MALTSSDHMTKTSPKLPRKEEITGYTEACPRVVWPRKDGVYVCVYYGPGIGGGVLVTPYKQQTQIFIFHIKEAF